MHYRQNRKPKIIAYFADVKAKPDIDNGRHLEWTIRLTNVQILLLYFTPISVG